jgi:hypothetical protein
VLSSELKVEKMKFEFDGIAKKRSGIETRGVYSLIKIFLYLQTQRISILSRPSKQE